MWQYIYIKYYRVQLRRDRISLKEKIASIKIREREREAKRGRGRERELKLDEACW